MNTSNEEINLLITIKTEPITAGILLSNKPVFLKDRCLFYLLNHLFSTYRPNRLVNGAAKSPPKTPPSAITEIAVEYKISCLYSLIVKL